MREYDFDNDLVGENMFSYRIEQNNIIIENFNKNNNIGKHIIQYFIKPNIHISELDERLLVLKELPYRFYRGTIEDVLIKINTILNYENKLKYFVYNEILNGIIYQGDLNDLNGVIDTYGIPVKDEIIEYSDNMRYKGGRSLVGIREIVYEDIKHRYYVFRNRSNIESQFYQDVLVNKILDKLITINIGNTSEDVIKTFGNNYWCKDEEDIIFMWGGEGGEEYR